MDVWAAFRHAHATAVEAIEDDLRERHGIGLTEFEVLLRLSQAPEEGLRMQDLTALALLTKSGVTRLVDRMERSGLVRRRSCSMDRRGTYAVLTPKGRRTLDAADPTARDGVHRHFAANVSDPESDAMLAAFRRIVEAHGKGAGLEVCVGAELPPRERRKR